jgi:SAM-dependent methyltransferase
MHGAAQEVELGVPADDYGRSSKAKTAAHAVSLVRYEWWFHGCALWRQAASSGADEAAPAVMRGAPMPLEDLMPTVMRWATATEALAALGAELSLQQPGAEAPPEIVGALQAVSSAAGIADLGELPPPQRAIVLALIRMYLHQATDLLEHADRAPGWTFTDPAILDGWGKGSAMVPALIASSHPDLAGVTSFLDVGTGVGLLAVAAASVWPSAAIVGIDPWDAALERARANVTDAGLDDRVTLRRQDLAALDDVDAFDCVWIPTFFLTEPDLEAGLAGVGRSLRAGGWVVLGRMRPPPDPLAEATALLRTIRGGGANLDPQRSVELLEAAGFEQVQTAQPPGPAPLEFVLGQQPAA